MPALCGDQDAPMSVLDQTPLEFEPTRIRWRLSTNTDESD
jgi:hypothetical protein